METSIVGRNLEVTDRFRDYALLKAEKLATFAPKAQWFEIKISRHNDYPGSNGSERVELTLIGPGPLIRAESDGGDKFAAFDLAMGKLMERVRRVRDRRKVHRGNHRPASVREVSNDGFRGVDITPASPAVLEQVRTGSIPVVNEQTEEKEDDYSPVIIRKKTFASTPMTVDDALYYMELVGHDFYLFIDEETERPSVVYRRKGWDYGVITLDDSAEEFQEAATAKRKVNAAV